MADKAILLGVNAYASVSEPRGSKNDVSAMREVLTSVCGFNDSNIKVLLDREVTETRIKQHMRWIFQDTKPGDRLLFHFSGHGSYNVDQNDDEAEGRDELICRCDTTSSDRALLGIPGLNCINDFVRYLDQPTIRQQVQSRFLRVVAPLPRSGAQVEIISHSWGTVVACESLGIMESAAAQFSGSVANFFTVGSALSIGYVKNRLIKAVRDGHRPRMVRNWVNLDARGDIVGGPLKGMSFDVDKEWLNLEPVGCNRNFPSPACAHSSYFNRENVVTNRDVFGLCMSAGETG